MMLMHGPASRRIVFESPFKSEFFRPFSLQLKRGSAKSCADYYTFVRLILKNSQGEITELIEA